ncbi:MAG: phosphatase PAP2 family protein [Saprospiraceae bacterium]|nr:phosphatase PAP2 family protein [Saprospiraceae bacterium]MDW8229173.1 phosphatase PAP2 family protein [Saprospiraceae bacterium]
MAWLQTLDLALFQIVNHHLANPAFDFLLPLFREKWFWAPLYLYVLAFAWQQFRRRRFWFFVLSVALSVGAADFISSSIIKKSVQRLRPCNDPAVRETVALRVSCGSGYSFTSSHAANHFAFAVFVGAALGRRMRRLRQGLLVWAGLVALAQVYVGVHYPLDVVFGGLLGAGIGGVFAAWFLKRAPFNGDWANSTPTDAAGSARA